MIYGKKCTLVHRRKVTTWLVSSDDEEEEDPQPKKRILKQSTNLPKRPEIDQPPMVIALSKLYTNTIIPTLYHITVCIITDKKKL